MTAVDARDLSRFLQHYAKQYHAGAFSTPMASEIAAMSPSLIRDLTDGAHRTVILAKRLTRDSARRDFVGNRIVLPAGATVVTDVARTPGAPIPSFADYDLVTTYVEDRELTEGLRQQGRDVLSTNVSSASEIIALWGPTGARQTYNAADLVTVGRVPVTPPAELRPRILEEITAAQGWDDDYPYYSDGSWSALSLRGFYPEDPTRGVKPAEMPKAWKAENPDDLARECDWTTLADRCPTIRSFVESVPWWTRLERVRLLRMEGRGGRGGALKRHSDITDRAAGTRDGQIARFHIALQTDPRIRMTAWNLDGTPTEIHLAPWDCWYLDQRKPHAVANPTGTDRIHLVVDVLCDPIVRQHIAAAVP